ncbi:hypothetical protein K501DRAFT_253958 [Backusella circina FSU 941]|nr:hypothetical protein K501DRAFT_253958 [Backusella circina FSU 941]
MDELTGQFVITLSLIIETNNTNAHDYFIPTLDTITIENYIRPLQIWCPLLNESFMACFLTRFKLEYHLSLLYDYFLLANGVFASGLKSVFYQDTRRPLTLSLNDNKAHIWPPRSFDLNMVLRALLLESSSSSQDLVTFAVRKDSSTKRWANPNAVEALDFLYLSYDPRYPLNVLINPPIIDKYNRIFTFLLRLQRAMYITKEIHKVLILRAKIGYWKGEFRDDVLHKYRFEFDQFISGFQGYVHDSVINLTWSHFMYQVKEMKHHTEDMPSDLMEPSTFREFHEHILDRILFQCFLKQSQQRVYKMFLPILEDLFAFADCIENEKNESRLLIKCQSIHTRFTEHRSKFIGTLIQVEKDGSGRLYNILNSTNNNRFQYLFVNQGELDVFVRDLLTRLCADTEYK